MRTRPFVLLASLSALSVAVACGGGAADEDDDDGSGATGGMTTSSTAGSGGSGATGAGTTSSTGGSTTSSTTSTSTSTSTSTTTTTSTGTGGCTPDCTNTECGPDPICGDDCGSCTGQDSCVSGSCVCQPSCANKECGSDGCSGSCGTCTTGTCTNNICVECQANQTECDPNDLTVVRTCGSNSKWQTNNCPSYEVCIQGSCQPVCDGNLATQTLPSVCFFPVKENGNDGLFYYSNDTAKLTPGTRVDGVVWDGNNNTPIYSTTGTNWPWAWSMIGSNEIAIAQFKLTCFSPPISRSRLYFRARRTGFVQNSYSSRYSFGASNGNIFASGTIYANYTWTNHYFQVLGTLASQYSASGWNFNMLSSVGDGFGHVPDEVEISWFLLEILD